MPAIPSNIKPRNVNDIKAGGLGTFFIGQIMDEVVFKTQNRLGKSLNFNKKLLNLLSNN
jgi:anti-sigma regulatory factor (Ser/Thr protein kinase)